MPTRDHLHVISMSALADVTGGARRKSSSGSNESLTLALQQVTSSLDDLKSSQNKNQNSTLSQFLPIMMMAKMARERQG
jgi:hypothetical protein